MFIRYARPVTALCLAAFMVVALPACKSGEKGSTSQPASMGAINETCPLSSEPVDKNTKPVEYDGHKIGFCCDNCRGVWDSKPSEEKAAYVKQQLNVSMGVINTHCPQMPQKEVDPSLEPVEYNGFKIGFCCGGCVKKWDNRSSEEKDAYVSAQNKSNLGVIGNLKSDCGAGSSDCSQASKSECDSTKQCPTSGE